MIPVINIEECDGCEECLEACPPEAIVLKEGKAYIEEDLCEECGECVAECPVKAIFLPRE
ncbi:MAG: 4Fe-4S binding protein [Bacteroidota bacterium]